MRDTTNNETAPEGAAGGMMRLRRALKIAVLLVLWTVQYVIWVPLVLTLKAIQYGLGLGLLGLLLIFIPVIGWIVLIFLLLSRGPSVSGLASLLRPWQI